MISITQYLEEGLFTGAFSTDPPGPTLPRNKVKAAVISILAKRIGKPERSIKETSHLVNDLGLDSLDTIELIMDLEEVFQIEISDDNEIAKLTTVKSVIDYIMTLGPEVEDYVNASKQLLKTRKISPLMKNKFKTKHPKLFKRTK